MSGLTVLHQGTSSRLFGCRTVDWDFIVAEIGEDEGILGNDFAMAHKIMVQPHEGAVFLPEAQVVLAGWLGERLSCVVRVITGV